MNKKHESFFYTINTKYSSSFLNTLAIYNLTAKETKRFLKMWQVNIIGPIISSLLLLAIFYLTLNNRVHYNTHGSFLVFIALGLTGMTLIQNAFSNTSFAILLAKINHTITDVFMAPMTSFEVVLSYAFAGMIRGITLGICLFIVFFLILRFNVHFSTLLYTFYYIFFGSFLLSVIGLISGLLVPTFDKLSVITNFIIQPLTFLSGTFYPIEVLLHSIPSSFHFLIYLDPFFYIIDGFRAGIIGADSLTHPMYGVYYIFALCVATFFYAYYLYEKKLRS